MLTKELGGFTDDVVRSDIEALISITDKPEDSDELYGVNLKLSRSTKYQQKPYCETLDIIIDCLQRLRENSEVKENFAGRRGLN